MVAAASKDRLRGMCESAIDFVITRLAKQDGPKPTTRSPGENPEVSAPAASTIPENSRPRVGPAKPFSIASSDNNPSAYIMSRKLRPVACTSTSISSCFGIVRGCDSQRKLRNWPGKSKPRRIVSFCFWTAARSLPAMALEIFTDSDSEKDDGVGCDTNASLGTKRAPLSPRIISDSSSGCMSSLASASVTSSLAR